MGHPLYVAFLWHMHQPYYRDASAGDFALPWTRLHATKDYLHMADVLADFPTIHATFNFVPSLIEQMQDYTGGHATDKALRISLKDKLSSDDKEFLLSFFFSINSDRVINRYQRYRELWREREEAGGDWRRLSDQYWKDLIVWFNLAWFDPGYAQRDTDLTRLLDKGRDFSEADIALVVEKSRNVAGPALAAYRRLEERGQVEICTSPYYHPILPLLIDGASARAATPGLPLPPTLFAYPEDATEQIRRALIAHEQSFGQPPQGMWPPEGSVSQAVAELIARQTDLRWIASDEVILARSLGVSIDRDEYGHVRNPGLLYQPYSIKTRSRRSGTPLAIMFRDHVLADRIGFVYQHMNSQSAAEDLVHRLHRAAENVSPDQPHLLSIILDGENCWEYYENNGDDFLRHLYGLLAASDDLRTVTMSEYLNEFPVRSSISKLASGSWIGGDMQTWIGEPAQNEAWDALARTRALMVSRAANDRSTSLDVIGQAWRELYIAEGSDWFWWYSSRNNPGSDVFDRLFRGHLAEVYRCLGQPAPDWLERPILVVREPQPGRAPAGYVTPALTAATLAGQMWENAGYLEPQGSSSTMQRSETLLRRLYYGYDASHLYLRIEISPTNAPHNVSVYIRSPRARSNRVAPRLQKSVAAASTGQGWSHELVFDLPSHNSALLAADGHEGWWPSSALFKVAMDGAVVEVGIPLAGLDMLLGDLANLLVVLGHSGVFEERQPGSGSLSFSLARMDDVRPA